MKHLSTQMKQQQIEWSRAKVLELSSQGYSEREIAQKLQPVAPVTVHRDLVYLNKQAKESLKTHLQEQSLMNISFVGQLTIKSQNKLGRL